MRISALAWGVLVVLATAPALAQPRTPPALKAARDDLRECIIRQAAALFARTDPWHLIFSIWATTQHYADFDVQVRAVLGVDRGGEGRFEDAARFLEQLFLDGLKPKG